MAFLLRWWQSVLHALAPRAERQHEGWVEPGNELTRAILSGETADLPELQGGSAPQPAISVYDDSAAAEADRPATADAPDVAMDAPAAEQQEEAPAPRTRKKRGHRAA